ncbi:MAG: hypothetical protein AAF337_14290, partial [Pseudomonadota bacterium]
NLAMTYRDLQAQDRTRAFMEERARDTRLHDASGKAVTGQELVALWKARIASKDPNLSYRDMIAQRQEAERLQSQAHQRTQTDTLTKDRQPAPPRKSPAPIRTPAQDQERRREDERRRQEALKKRQEKTPEAKAQEREKKDTPVRERIRRRPDQGRER